MVASFLSYYDFWSYHEYWYIYHTILSGKLLRVPLTTKSKRHVHYFETNQENVTRTSKYPIKVKIRKPMFKERNLETIKTMPLCILSMQKLNVTLQTNIVKLENSRI